MEEKMNWKLVLILVFLGWRNARGCEIEHQVCMKYGIKILYSDFLNYGENNQGIISKINNSNTITVSDGLIGSNTGIVYR